MSAGGHLVPEAWADGLDPDGSIRAGWALEARLKAQGLEHWPIEAREHPDQPSYLAHLWAPTWQDACRLALYHPDALGLPFTPCIAGLSDHGHGPHPGYSYRLHDYALS